MADTWTVEISYDGVNWTPNDEGNPDGRAHVFIIGLVLLALPAGDPIPRYNPPTDYGHFLVVLAVNGSGDASFGVQAQSADSEIIPWNWSGFPGAFGLSGHPTSEFLSGGTITVTKDFDADQMTFTSPIGTFSLTLSDLDPFVSQSYLNTHPLVAQGYGARFSVPEPTFSYPPVALSHAVKFYDLTQKKNGVTQETIGLSAADPGTWYPPNAVAFDPDVGGTSGVISPWWVWSQQATRQALDVNVTLANWPWSGNSPPQPDYRIFDYWRSRLTILNSSVDYTVGPEYPLLWRGLVKPSSQDTVTVERSFDHGYTWLASTAYNSTGSQNQCVSVNYLWGRVYLTWSDGTDIKQSFSLDAGATWSTVTTIPYTAAYPRVIIEPESGFALYLFFDGTDIKVARSHDQGATFLDASPRTVATSANPQQVDAAFAVDGSIVVTYLDGTIWRQKRSRDMGLSWG
jgi:hypothetical protein